jgi:hypothetical protein
MFERREYNCSGYAFFNRYLLSLNVKESNESKSLQYHFSFIFLLQIVGYLNFQVLRACRERNEMDACLRLITAHASKLLSKIYR